MFTGRCRERATTRGHPCSDHGRCVVDVGLVLLVSCLLTVPADHLRPVIRDDHLSWWRPKWRFHDDVAGQALHGVGEVKEEGVRLLG